MDRQALLEQKRQRLQELKQRRAELKTDVPAVSLPVKVDFAVQVDVQQPVHVSVQQAPATSAVRFEKGIQTHFEDVSDEKETLPEPEVQPEEPETKITPTPAQIVESSLQEQLTRSGLDSCFSDLRLGIKDHESVASDGKDTFNVVESISVLSRPVVAVSTCSRFPELLLIGYGGVLDKTRFDPDNISASPGLAVVFNRKSMVPEFFLQCTSRITTVQFSQDPFKIVAGLENGRVVMWDLSDVQPTQIAVLPTLQTTTLASSGERSKQKYIHHTSPIISIKPLDSSLGSGIMSVSTEGVLNVWSLNFLAFPKLDSVRLSHSDRLKDQIAVSDMVLLSHPVITDEKHARTPEFRFLNQTVLGSLNGNLYRLLNGKDTNYLAGTFLSPGQVTCMVEMPVSPTASVVVSAHTDWNLRVWDMTKTEPIATIPTSTVVSRICVRLGHPFQMITLGSVSPPKVAPSIQFWDLQARLMAPISTLVTEKKCATSATFGLDGAHVIVGFDDGGVTVWEIDETQLHSTSRIDDGILAILRAL